jgi:hypothetical protein
MSKRPYSDASEDSAATAEEDLWFLPGPMDEEDEGFQRSPLPKAPTLRAELKDWVQAEADNAAQLARAAAVFGALDDRLCHASQGAALRLALLEASELSWLSGDRISVDRLALWHGLHLAGVQEDAQALTRTGWALRKLAGGPGPEDMAWFLGRPDAATQEWQDQMAEAEHLHPMTRAAMGYLLWQRVVEGSAAITEGGVVAARIAATCGRGGALFMPLAQGGSRALQGGGSIAERLARWLIGAESACLAALLHLDRITAWQSRASLALADLSGRTPALLITAFASWPVLSGPLAEAQTGASRATVQRNIDGFVKRGLLREITGQGRYRLWAAAL